MHAPAEGVDYDCQVLGVLLQVVHLVSELLVHHLHLADAALHLSQLAVHRRQIERVQLQVLGNCLVRLLRLFDLWREGNERIAL